MTLRPVRESVLELVVGGLPFPHGGPQGEWRYRHAVRPEGPSPLDAQVVADFLRYEEAHGRHVAVLADAALADWRTWPAAGERLAPGVFGTQCCTQVYPDGCGSALVCHGAPASVAARILEDGHLRSASAVSGQPAEMLAAAST